jgi:RNA polymerase sigma-70 factor, ECF subfamily
MIGLRFPELLVAAQGGDEQAFAVLWRDLQPAVLRYFQVAAAEAAEDLAADTWMSVIGGLEVAEVARIVGKRPGTVRILAHRGLRRLARRVEAGGLVWGVTR